MTKKTISIGIFLIFLSSSRILAVQVIEAKQDLLKLSPAIVATAEAVISIHPLSIAEIKEDSIPAFVECHDCNWGVALSTAKSLYVFDPSCASVLRMLPLSDVNQIVGRFPGSTDFLISYGSGGKQVLSRVDLANGKILWTRDYDFVNWYLVGPEDYLPRVFFFGNYFRGAITLYTFKFPTAVHFNAANNQILFEGVTQKGKYRIIPALFKGLFSRKDPLDWGSRFLIVDASTGQTIQDEKYDLQRTVGGTLKIFISLERNEFKVFDTATLQFIMSGKFEPGDVLVKKGYTPPIEIWDREMVMLSDIDAFLAADGLLLLSSNRKRSMMSLKYVRGEIETRWVKFDSSGNRVGPVSSSPLTSLGLRARYQGEGAGPTVLLGIKNKYMGPKVENFIVVQKDGILSEAPLPKLKNLASADFIHDGQNLYTIFVGAMYRSAIGEENAVPIWNVPSGSSFGGSSEGYDVPPSLYWEVLDATRAVKELPEEGLPPAFKKYMDVFTAGHDYGKRERNNLRQIQALRVWGEDLQKDLGDVLLVPALLKGDNALLVGIRLPQNEIIFQVPMMYFNGLPKEDFEEGAAFLYGLKYVDRQRALLVVGDKLNSFKVYTLTRPTMQ